jgi:hypothetical protein
MQLTRSALTGAAGLGHDLVEIVLEDVPSIGQLGDPDNAVLTIDIAQSIGAQSGAPMTIIGIGWDVQIDTLGTPSWLSEATVYFDDNIAPDSSGLFLSPGAGYGSPGVGSFSGPVQYLADLGIPDIQLPNGELRLEFFETYDDAGVFQDAVWNGSLHVLVWNIEPAPSAVAVFGLAGLVGSRRRRD